MEEEIKYFPEEVYEGLGDKESLLAYPDHVFVSSTWVKHFHKFTSVSVVTRVLDLFLFSRYNTAFTTNHNERQFPPEQSN